MTTIRYWYNKFKRGRTSIFDEERPGHPIKVTTEDMVNKIHDIVLADRRVKIREIANIVKISTERIQNVLHETLGNWKSYRWDRFAHSGTKTESHDNFKALFGVFKCNPKEFRHCWWIHHYTPETKEQSKQWIKSGESTPKKAKTVPSAGKIAIVFWDSRGIIFTDCLEKGRTITGQYYIDLLDRFDAELKKKRPHLVKKKCSFTIITH